MDLRQNAKYGVFMEKIGWKTIVIGNPDSRIQIFVRRLWVFGAIAKIQRSIYPLPWDMVDEILRNNKVWMVKLEPDLREGDDVHDLKRHGFRQDKWPLLASKTMVTDLNRSLIEIRNSFKKDARYSLRKVQKELDDGLIKVVKNDFEQFYICWSKSSKMKGLWIPREKDFRNMVNVFGEDCFCLLALAKDKVVGGVFVLIADKIAFYYYSASLYEGKILNVPYLLIWEAMKEAKKIGCKLFDFEGIYDERWPNKSWVGFSHFKNSFGGEEVKYAGSFTKWKVPF